MRVGALETIGRDGELSTPNKEFNPPSCRTIEIKWIKHHDTTKYAIK